MGRKKDWPELTDGLYNAMLSCWLESPTIKYVMEELELPRSLVLHVRDKGIPELGHPPLSTIEPAPDIEPPPNGKGRPRGDKSIDARFLVTHEEAQQHVKRAREKLAELQGIAAEAGQEANLAEAQQEADGTMVMLEDTKKRLDLEDKRLATVEKRAITADNVQRSAQEAAVARVAFKNCLDIGAIFSHLIDAMMVGLESGEIMLPKIVDAKIIASLASSADRLTAAMERAVRIEKGRAGAPEQNIGVKIGILLNNCDEDELDEIINKKRLPQRLVALSISGDSEGS